MTRYLLHKEANHQIEPNEFGQRLVVWEMVFYNDQVDAIERINRLEVIGGMPYTEQEAEIESDIEEGEITEDAIQE